MIRLRPLPADRSPASDAEPGCLHSRCPTLRASDPQPRFDLIEESINVLLVVARAQLSEEELLVANLIGYQRWFPYPEERIPNSVDEGVNVLHAIARPQTGSRKPHCLGPPGENRAASFRVWRRYGGLLFHAGTGSCSQVAGGGDRWLLMAIRGHLRGTLVMRRPGARWSGGAARPLLRIGCVAGASVVAVGTATQMIVVPSLWSARCGSGGWRWLCFSVSGVSPVTGLHGAGDGPRPVRAGCRLALGL